MHYAPCARLLQLAQPLADEGHQVFVLAATMPGTTKKAPVRRFERQNIDFLRCELQDLNSDELRGFIEESRADLLIGVTPRPAAWAIRHAGDRPLWIDLFGDLMAEAQAREIVFPGDERLEAYRNILAELLEAGDAFSTVSEVQINVLIGQLGLAGRLTADLIGGGASQSDPGKSLSCGIPIFSLPCAAPFISPDPGPDSIPTDLPTGAFIILSSGGFNTWLDIETLFAGLEKAMEERENLYFLATGGGIPGQDEESFRHWTQLLEGSRHRQRYMMLGFLRPGELAALIHRADLGLICEKDILERCLGSSGRVAHWLKAGLPVVCTPLSELGREIGARGMGRCYRPGDAGDLARILVELRDSPTDLKAMAHAAAAFARDELSPEATTRPLRQWVHTAEKLPGSRQRSVSRMVALLDEISELKGMVDSRDQRIIELQSDLGEIHHSRMWSWWMRYLDLREKLLKLLPWKNTAR